MALPMLPTHQQLRRLAPGLSPAIAKRRYRKTLKAEHIHWRGLSQTLHNEQPYTKQPGLPSLQVKNTSRRRKGRTVRVGWEPDEWEDGRRLASDPTVALPGEGHRSKPRLERQEAFRAPKTWLLSDSDLVADDAELYRMGLLYDDDDDDDGNDGDNERARGPAFCLDAIAHVDPVYSMRPAKRTKRSHHPRQLALSKEDLYLSVELLSAYLSNDAAIARFFTPGGGEEHAPLYPNDLDGLGYENNNNNKNGSTDRESPAGPLTVIYELLESSTQSLAPTPAATDFPDLISDTDAGDNDNDEEDSNFGNDWALVPDPCADASLDVPNSTDANGGGGGGADVDVVADGEDVAAAADDAWIVLAGDDS
ncbi:hypothetical protein F5Y19DRAFT_112333 [Xylariaceae sp. FL1651]|nr:hypothetical protein F5Y19DRAFT_112333 [Xylariaceae sp. FL1651]